MPVQTNKNALENTDLAHVNQYSSPAPPIEQRGGQGDEEDEHGGRQGETGGCPSAEGDSLIRSSNHQDPKVGIQGKEINDRNTLQAARKSEFQKTFEVPQKCGFKVSVEGESDRRALRGVWYGGLCSGWKTTGWCLENEIQPAAVTLSVSWLGYPLCVFKRRDLVV